MDTDYAVLLAQHLVEQALRERRADPLSPFGPSAPEMEEMIPLLAELRAVRAAEPPAPAVRYATLLECASSCLAVGAGEAAAGEEARSIVAVECADRILALKDGGL